MNANLIVKEDTKDLRSEKQDHRLALKIKIQLLAEVPEVREKGGHAFQ